MKRKSNKVYSLPKRCCSCLSEEIPGRVKVRGWGFGTFYSIEVPVCERCHRRIKRRGRTYYLVFALYTLLYLLCAITNPVGPWQTTLVVYFWLYFLSLFALSFILNLTPIGRFRPGTVKFGRIKFANREYERLFLNMNREKMMFRE